MAFVARPVPPTKVPPDSSPGVILAPHKHHVVHWGPNQKTQFLQATRSRPPIKTWPWGGLHVSRAQEHIPHTSPFPPLCLGSRPEMTGLRWGREPGGDSESGRMRTPCDVVRGCPGWLVFGGGGTRGCVGSEGTCTAHGRRGLVSERFLLWQCFSSWRTPRS